MERDPRQYRDFEFNLREFAGSMGDFGTLFPLAIGLIAVNGMDPTGLFVMLGLTNIATGLIYRMPMPVEPKKVVSAAAIAQGWSASVVVASGLGLGLIWFAITATGAVRRLVRVTPVYIVRGIQLALGVSLALSAWQMSASEVWLMGLALGVIFLFRRHPYSPSALIIMALGVAIMAMRGDLAGHVTLSLSLPVFAVPTLEDVWRGLLWAGFAQIPLTLTNAVLATATMIRDLFPEKQVSEERLMVNMGAMNVASAFFGGMPMCHGSGGLMGQYYFGARTGGTNIIEGVLEVALGVLLGRSLLGLLSAFPLALVGGMMLVVGLQFARPVVQLRGLPLALCLLTAAVSVLTNMAVGFVVGLGAAHLLPLLGLATSETAKETPDGCC